MRRRRMLATAAHAAGALSAMIVALRRALSFPASFDAVRAIGLSLRHDYVSQTLLDDFTCGTLERVRDKCDAAFGWNNEMRTAASSTANKIGR